MKKYEILEHKADLKIKAFGQDLAELFVNAALALAEQQAADLGLKPKESWEEVKIESSDLNSLLVDWLNEILYLSEVNHCLYFDFRIEELTHTRLKAKIRGRPMTQKKIDIKAVTYHGLEIKKIDNRWQAVILFDI